MLRINRAEKKFTRLNKPDLSKIGLTERYDLQHMIKNSPGEFFQEMGESLLLIGEEVRPTDFVEDRIDLLAVDQQGSLVVIELKRGSNKLQLLQALSYASMVSKWEHSQIISQRQQFAKLSEEDAEEEIEQFLLQDVANLNDNQRIILVAEDFDYEVLVTSEWLSEIYNVDIRCFRLTLSAEDKTEFLTCTCIYPPPEITKHSIKRGRKGTTDANTKWSNWDDALKAIDNKAIIDFYKRELNSGQENYLGKRILFYRLNGQRRFFVAARNKAAYVWQNRRFDDDENYWINKIGDHIDIKSVKDATCLRFFLSKAHDFEQFIDAINGDLQSIEFSEGRIETENDEEIS